MFCLLERQNRGQMEQQQQQQNVSIVMSFPRTYRVYMEL